MQEDVVLLNRDKNLEKETVLPRVTFRYLQVTFKGILVLRRVGLSVNSVVTKEIFGFGGIDYDTQLGTISRYPLRSE